jgi:hypothetical protein
VPNPFLNRVERDHPDDDELRAAAAKVRDTVNSEGWQLIQALVDTAHSDALARLFEGHRASNGRVLEQAEYARLCGFLAGLLEPQNAARAYEQAVSRLDAQQ